MLGAEVWPTTLDPVSLKAVAAQTTQGGGALSGRGVSVGECT